MWVSGYTGECGAWYSLQPTGDIDIYRFDCCSSPARLDIRDGYNTGYSGSDDEDITTSRDTWIVLAIFHRLTCVAEMQHGHVMTRYRSGYS